MAQDLLDFLRIEVRNAPSARKKLGVVGAVDPEAAVNFGSLDLETPLPAGSGGTGQATYQEGDLLVGNGLKGMDRLSADAAGYLLRSRGAGRKPYWSPLIVTIADLAGIIPPDFFAHLVTDEGLTVTTRGGEPIWA